MKNKFISISKKLVIAAMMALCFVSLSGTCSNAATYTGYVLKIGKANTYTSVHSKTTKKGYIENEVTAMTDASYANFWAINSSKDIISNKYKQGLNTGNIQIKFTTSGYKKVGAQVGMAMENYYVSTTRGFVSGTVDFK